MAWLFVAGDTDPGNRLTDWSFKLVRTLRKRSLSGELCSKPNPTCTTPVPLFVPRVRSMRLPGREREINRPQRRAVRRSETDILSAIHLNLVVSRRLECVG